jgi:hypothetical protein
MSGAAEPILLKNVWKLYGKTKALAGLSLAVPPESIFGGSKKDGQPALSCDIHSIPMPRARATEEKTTNHL